MRNIIRLLKQRIVWISDQLKSLITRVDDLETDGISSSTLVYKALISQISTDDPTVKIIINTLGIIPTFSRSGVGIHAINGSDNVFTEDKVAVFATLAKGGGGGIGDVFVVWTDVNTLAITTSSILTNNAQDIILNDTLLSIEVYP